MNPLSPGGTKGKLIATAWPGDYGVLSEPAADQLSHLKKELTNQWKTGGEAERRRLSYVRGCIDRLESFLLQVRRVFDHAESLAEDALARTPVRARLHPGACVGVAADEACTDFESLLFHGRAALDSMTYFVSGEFGSRSDRFSRLSKILSASSATSARRYLKHLDASDGLPGILADSEGKRSLRSQTIHQRSVGEGARNVFTIHHLEDRFVILFDCESLGYLVIATTRKLAAEVPFLVQNSLAVGLNWREVKKGKFEPEWANPSVVFSDYLDESGAGPVFAVIRMNPDSFDMESHRLREDVLRHKISFS